ncbi:MAG: phosphomannomutase, partial [Chloroflexi bacterium]
MATLEASIFKKYDIRGRAQGDDPTLTPEVAHLIGRAFGTWLQQMENINTCVVGRDNRHTSASLQEALMDGLQASGTHVVDIGLVATPLVYWHAVKLGKVGGAMVTASHLGPQHNGFKLCIGNRTIYG